jgi:PEP-CTERM motif
MLIENIIRSPMKTLLFPFCFLSALAVALWTDASHAATLNFSGVGTVIPGYSTGTSDDVDVNDYVLYTNQGTDNNGVPYDIIIRLNGKGTDTVFDASLPDAPLHVKGLADLWADVTMFGIAAGSSTPSNSLGNRLSFNGVADFTAKDIDSSRNANFTDVFGLYDAPGSLTIGANLELGGFLNDDGHPTVDLTYVRSRPAIPGDWRSVPNAAPEDASYFATWDYASADLEEIRFVWGATHVIDDSLFNVRGMLASLTFTTVPEPTTVLLIGLGIPGLVVRRRR